MLRRASPTGARCATRRPGERGAIAMAVMVVVICAALATAMVTRNLATAGRSVHDQHRAEALGSAELGLAHAQAAIGAGASASFRASSGGDGPRWEVEVDAAGGGVFELRSTGTSHGERRTIELHVERRADGVHADAWHEVAPAG